MKFVSTVVSFFAVCSVATAVVASSQHEVQHRLRGGVPASYTAKTVEERRLGVCGWAGCPSITDTVCAMEGVTVFCDVLKEMMLIPVSTSEDTYRIFHQANGLNDESEDFTIFVPTDTAFAKISTAFEKLSNEEAGRVIMFHLYKGMMLTSDKLECGEKIISMNENGDASRTKCMGDNKYQNGNGNTKKGTMPEIATADTKACNGIIHTLDDVMFPVSLSQLAEADASNVSASTDSDDFLSASYEFSADSDTSSDMSNVTAGKGYGGYGSGY